MTTILRRLAALAASAILALTPCAGLAQAMTWGQILETYPGKPVEDLEGSLIVTATRTWQEAEEELEEQQMTIQVFSADGEEIDLAGAPARLCTGQYGAFYFSGYAQGVRLFSVIIRGDVRGTGQLNITQLVCLADAITSRKPLEGVYAKAADLNGNGEIDIMDLVELARWLCSSMEARTAEPILILPDSIC